MLFAIPILCDGVLYFYGRFRKNLADFAITRTRIISLGASAFGVQALFYLIV
jgi:hypothetical protein